MLLLPEENIDLLDLKLAVDKAIDSATDADATRTQVEAMVSDIRRNLQATATSLQKLGAIRQYLYGKGPWNNFQPFQYDFSDPKGTNLKSKTLSLYIETRKGNCVSMPMLLIVLADRLGLDVSASTAPEHVLVKFTETETGQTYNVEATSGGGFARDLWYKDQFKITAQAMNSGIYLQKLSKKETASVIVTLLGEHYVRQGDYENAIKVFERVLKLHPKSVYSMLKIGASYAKLLESRFFNKYPNIQDVPVKDRSLLKFYMAQNAKYFEKAESLGWRHVAVEPADSKALKRVQ